MAASTDEKPTIQERYRAAIRTRTLASDPRTVKSPSDVLGAMALADRRLTSGWVPTGPDGQGYTLHNGSELAVPLERLFAGDNRAARAIVEILAGMVWGRAKAQRLKPKVVAWEAFDIARACLAWHRDGRCKACGGHGYELVAGAARPTLSERECQPCRGLGKIPFEEAFPADRRDLARWLVAEMDRAMGQAGPAAMDALADRMNL